MPIINDTEQSKREAYRLIWNKRDAKVPRKSITWGDWFKQQYGEDIEKYHHRLYMRNLGKLYGAANG